MAIAIATLLAFAALLTLIHLSAIAMVAALLRARPRIFKLFFGPSILKKKIGATSYELGMLPFGGFVSFRMGTDEPDALLALHPIKQALVAAAGCTLLVITGLVLGTNIISFINAFSQFVLGTFHPTTQGAALVGRLLALLDGVPSGALGVMAMKMAACNLLPFPSMNGFQILVAVAAALSGKRVTPENIPRAIQGAGFLMLLGFAICWLFALITALSE